MGGTAFSVIVTRKSDAKFEKQNQALQEELILLKQGNEQLGAKLAQLRKNYDDFFEGKGLMRLLAKLVEKQKKMAEEFEGVRGKKFDIVFSHHS